MMNFRKNKYLLASVVMIFSLTACASADLYTGATSATSELVSTDTGHKEVDKGSIDTLLLNTVSANTKDKKSITEMLQAPKRMKLSVTDQKGDISVDVDADIIIPDIDSISVVRVTKRDFTQEEANRVIDYFIGDADFNDRYEVGYSSEEQRLMQWINELPKITNPAEKEKIQRSIDKFKSAGIKVPDKPHEVLPASKVFKQTENGVAQIKGYSKEGSNHKYLTISNNLAENKNILLYTCEQNGYADSGYGGNYFSEAGKVNLEKLELGAAEKIPLSISPEDAINKAVKALQALKISDMELYSCEEVWGGTFLKGGTVKQQEHHAYRLEFVRNIGGALITYTENKIERTSVEIDERTGKRLAESWPYERVMFIIDDTGIVEFLWESPYKVTEQEVEHARLMPFKDIEAVFSKMILVTHAQNYAGVKLNFNIDQVRLGMMRIQDKNGTGTGVIVPVWDFFGIMAIDGEKIPERNVSYLTINAIDGSIINRMKGY